MTGNTIEKCDGCAVSVSSAAMADMSMQVIEYCTRGGVIVSGAGTCLVLVQNAISGCGGHGLLLLSGGDVRIEDNVIEVCQKACICINGARSTATICANTLRIWPEHSYPHIDCDRNSTVKAYGNVAELIGYVGKLNKEGALIDDHPANQRRSSAEAPATSTKTRENQFDFISDRENPWLKSMEGATMPQLYGHAPT
jgi:hypothetical protein